MSSRHLTIAVTLAALQGACVRAPDHSAIAPFFIPPQAYTGASCTQLLQMRAKTQRSLLFASFAQDQQARDDDTRTFGVPTPMGTLFERSRAVDVADLKGETLALDAQLQRSGCVFHDRP